MKITPAHDPNDYECGKRHGLEMITVIGEDGFMLGNCGEEFEGMKRFHARKGVIERLREKGPKQPKGTRRIPWWSPFARGARILWSRC